jgi:hypothetical protein
VIAYRHIWGITRGMDVSWTFAERPDGVDVAIRHDFAPPWPVVGNLIASTIIGPQFVDAIARRTLSTIKAIVERETAMRGGST